MEERIIDHEEGRKIRVTRTAAGGVHDAVEDGTEAAASEEEVLLDLMAARKGHFVNYPDSMDGTWQPYDGQEEDIARLERALQTVGDDEPFGPVPDTVPLDTPYTYALPDGKRFRIRVSERELTARAYFPRGFEQAESMVMDGEAYPGEPAGTTLQNVKISQEEAEAAAEAFLEHAGLAYLGLAEAEKARILQSTTYETLSEGWQLTYARSDGGCIPVYYSGGPAALRGRERHTVRQLAFSARDCGDDERERAAAGV